MENLFWVDHPRNMIKRYSDFIEDLNNANTLKKYIYTTDPYDIFLSLTLAMLYGKKVELLDGDFTENDLSSLGLSYEEDMKREISLEGKNNISSFEDLIKGIQDNEEEFSITLYTSGTTGRPKKIVHSLTNLTRNVKIGRRFENDVWALAYNPTHFASLQVFFQALFNRNGIIYIFDEDKNSIETIFLKYNITKISATPTFYRNILPYIKKQLPSVDSVTCGGEKFDITLNKYFNNIFPNARLRNVYASTEAGSLFGTDGDFFTISDKIADKINISEENELQIHYSLLGQSEDLTLNGEWYNTGDIIELAGERKFKFVSRNTDFLNIGGYRVNPIEIEELILNLDCVKDVLVYGRKNRITGNVLAVDIVKQNVIDDNKKIQNEVSDYLKRIVQYWKVPRLFKFVENLDQTRTGKKVRIK